MGPLASRPLSDGASPRNSNVRSAACDRGEPPSSSFASILPSCSTPSLLDSDAAALSSSSISFNGGGVGGASGIVFAISLTMILSQSVSPRATTHIAFDRALISIASRSTSVITSEPTSTGKPDKAISASFSAPPESARSTSSSFSAGTTNVSVATDGAPASQTTDSGVGRMAVMPRVVRVAGRASSGTCMRSISSVSAPSSTMRTWDAGCEERFRSAMEHVLRVSSSSERASVVSAGTTPSSTSLRRSVVCFVRFIRAMAHCFCVSV
mmetsp:Transcript_112275/g.272686  ORF Transcript_112275/g.272686 Transcript_112275/m.272686 type:complete len:268 (+) Transcript_112275:339-1142(+)